MMRQLPWLALAISLTFATHAEARLFWQTYGATVPTADGGCAWNANQDYFVPRHCSTGRYGLYSSCKSSHSTSPACHHEHPLYPGYCGIYGPLHYHHRDHVYSRECGCTPLRIGTAHGQNPCKSGLCKKNCGAPAASCCATGMCAGGLAEVETMAGLPNVEPGHLDILGSIPVEGGELLTRTDINQLGREGVGQFPLLPPGALQQLENLPSLGQPPAATPQLPQLTPGF